jgi:hypothetical protein
LTEERVGAVEDWRRKGWSREVRVCRKRRVRARRVSSECKNDIVTTVRKIK